MRYLGRMVLGHEARNLDHRPLMDIRTGSRVGTYESIEIECVVKVVEV